MDFTKSGCGRRGGGWQYVIIDYKGSTYFAVGLALVRIVGAILRNEKSVLTVSTLLTGEYGVNDLCLSVPCIVSRHGIERILAGNRNQEETAALQQSAELLKQRIKQVIPESE